MDPVTQGALGAALPQGVIRNRDHLKRAAIIGWLSGMAPDIDVLIQSPQDPLLFLEFHRQFTHSLIFIPFGALVCCAVFYPFVRSQLSLRSTYLYCLLGYATHGVLDACTTYGTLLLWPFSNARIAWHTVSVVDPLVTVPLVFMVVLCVVRQNPRYAQAGLLWVCCYLLIGVAQRERAEAAGADLAANRGHNPVRLEAKPGFGNLLLWKIVYETEARFHVDAVRVGFDTKIFPGESATKLRMETHFPKLDPSSQQAMDIQRFTWFSNGYVAISPEDSDQVIDVRYSLLPNRIDPLWFIRVDRNRPDSHVQFIPNRRASPEQTQALMDMLLNSQ